MIMKIEILDKSKVKIGETGTEAKRCENVTSDEKICGTGIKIVDKCDTAGHKVKKCMDILTAGKILKCERLELGASDNCALCQGVDNEIFVKCKNKWANY
jgi:hypothetical protein